jgi:DNA-binding MarR family transcriptional regulator
MNKANAKPDAGDTAAELLKIVPLINRVIVDEVRREAGQDTTMPQYRVLQYLSDGPMSLSDLARKRRVSLQSMGELAQALVDRGWVARKPNPDDRRQQFLELTRQGRRHHERAQDNMLRRLTPVMAELSDDEHKAVRVALDALHRVLTHVPEEPEKLLHEASA